MRQASNLRSVLDTWRTRLSRRGLQGARPLTRDDGLVVDADLLTKLDRLTLALGRDLISGLMGEHLASRRTTGIEFADYRAYSVGDDLRRVDWNAYARLGTLHVRQAQAEHDTVLYVLVDASPSMAHGAPTKFLSARRLAAALGYVGLTHLDAVVMTTPGAAVAGSPTGGRETRYRGRAESGSLFRDLQGIEPRSVAGFDRLLANWSAGRGQGRIAVVISDLLLDGYRDGVRQLLSAGFQTTVLHVLSPEELSPIDEGDLELVDSETGERMDVHLGKEAMHEYHHRLNDWLAECQGWCRTHGANYLLVRSDWDVERVMLDMLRRRGVTA